MSLAREAAVAWSAAVSAAAASGRFAPRGSGLSAPAAQSLADFVAGGGGRLLAITGAGCSTESGVPDYRSPQGSYSRGHKPMLHSEFVGKASNRARYWARSLGGWRYFAEVARTPRGTPEAGPSRPLTRASLASSALFYPNTTRRLLSRSAL